MARQAVDTLAFPNQKKEYIVNVLDPVLEEMVQKILNEMPPDPVDYMILYLRRKAGVRPTDVPQTAAVDAAKTTAAPAAAPAKETPKAASDDDESEEESDDELDEEPPPVPRKTGPRQSVSAEAYGQWNQKKEFVPPTYPKTAEQNERLSKTLNKSFLFQALNEKDLDTVTLALEEVIYDAGATIITEGDDGEHLFIIEEGEPVCKKKIDGVEKVVKHCKPGDVFGELALLYNCPRAATVDATSRCLCWRLDRETFNSIVKSAATKRTVQYDSFLQKVSLFATMDTYERGQLLDSLKQGTYKMGDHVVKQGEPGDKFYILEEGVLIATKDQPGKKPLQVKEYGVGDYFGELALLRNQPRAANILVTSDTAKVLSLDRKSFTNMLGPLEDLLKRGADAYK